MCLICQRVTLNEAMKPSRLKEHLNKKNADKKDKIFKTANFIKPL